MEGYWGGIYYLAFVVVILSVIRWCLVNDTRRSEEVSKGLFAMSNTRKVQPKLSEATQPCNRP